MTDRAITLISVVITGLVSLFSIYLNNENQKEILELTLRSELQAAEHAEKMQIRKENCQKVDGLLIELNQALDKAYDKEALSNKEKVALFKAVAFMNDNELDSEEENLIESYEKALKTVAIEYAKCIKNA